MIAYIQLDQKFPNFCFAKLAKMRALKLHVPNEYFKNVVIDGGILYRGKVIERTIRLN